MDFASYMHKAVEKLKVDFTSYMHKPVEKKASALSKYLLIWFSSGHSYVLTVNNSAREKGLTIGLGWFI